MGKEKNSYLCTLTKNRVVDTQNMCRYGPQHYKWYGRDSDHKNTTTRVVMPRNILHCSTHFSEFFSSNSLCPKQAQQTNSNYWIFLNTISSTSITSNSEIHQHIHKIL